MNVYSTGVQPVLAEYHISPEDCDFILSTHKIICEKLHKDALARNGPWKELVAHQDKS